MQAEDRVLSSLSGRPISELRTPTTPTSLSGVLDRAAAGTADVITIDSDGSERRETWKAFRDRVRRIAQVIRESGIDRGAIAIVAATEPSQILALFWSSIVAGIEPLLVPAELLDDRGSDREWLATLVRHAPVRALVHADEARFPIMSEAPGEVRCVPLALDPGEAGPDRADDSSDSRVHFMTSGSTGTPKVVPQRHRGIIDMALGAVTVNELDSTTVGFNWLPLSHVGGMLMTHVRDAVIAAEHISASPERILTDPHEWFRIVTRHRVSALWSPNFAYRLLAGVAEEIPLDGRIDLTSIRFCLNGGEAVSAKDCAWFEQSLGRLGMPARTLAPAWGMAETCSGVLYSPHYDPTADTAPTVSVGFPLPGAEVRIVAAGDVEEDGVGHLEVRGPMVLENYLVGGDLTKSADGWFRTGDLARIDADGVHIVGRDGTRIVANGVTWNSADLESEVDQVGGVVPGTAVVASYRPRGGERDEIAVFCTVDKDPAEVCADVRRRVEKILGMPVAHVVDIPATAIERTSIGKVRKATLVKRFLDPDPPLLWELSWTPTPTAASERQHHTRPVILRGPGLKHSAASDYRPQQLHDLLEHWRQVIDPAQWRGHDVCVVVETFESQAARLPWSHPVAAFLRAHAHSAGARSVRTIWVHPLVDQQELADILDSASAPDTTADLFIGPRGDLWRRVRTVVSIERTSPPAAHVVLLGGTGRLGEALGAELSLRGARVTLVGRGARATDSAADGIDRVGVDLNSPTAARDLVEQVEWNNAEQTQVVHLAGEPMPAPEDVVERLIGPKTEGVRTAVELAHTVDAHLTIVSSINAHVGGTGVETYAAACAAAELIAERVASVPITTVSVTSVREARQIGEDNVAVAKALGLDEVSVVDLATCLLAEPTCAVLLGVGEHMPFVPRHESAPVTSSPPTASADTVAPDEAEWPRTAVELAHAVRPLVSPGVLGLDRTWFDMGLSSVDLPNLARVCTEHTGRKIGVVDLMRYPTLAQLAEHLEVDQDRSRG
ncbi:AMP-binding protein [Saccharomonospora sp. NB11]|uniref:AMP-binding protein n=1 Tax=Saccharomonospora sp. NB11 TaxID=1642298 RepID=UPI0018D0501D|nr:AMP-binding protein [Saccharomonospora sp. NB11]